MRRTLIIIAAIIVLLGVGVAVYFVFFNRTASLTGQEGITFPQSGTDGEVPSEVVPTQELGVPSAGAGTEIAPKLVRITDRPVALGSVAVFIPGFRPATTTASSTEAFRDPDVRVEYIERESGNVYDYQAHARTLTRLSNKTLPGIQEATWLSDGSMSYARFLERSGSNVEHVNTYALPAQGDGGYFLEQDLDQVITLGTSTLVTLLSTTEGSSATISSPSGTGVRTLFTTALSSIRIAFSGSDFVVTTKASALADGYAFTVDARTGTFTRALGPLKSLTTLPSPSGKQILYSYLDRGVIALGLLDLTTHVATRLPLATLPEKCAWTSDSLSIYCGVPTSITGRQPDDWYQGAMHFSDRLWEIDLASRVASLVIDPRQEGQTEIDMIGLSLDRTNDVLIFHNKRDANLYAYDL